ncbi:protein N-lysine methyltransferase METTL21D-like isoform X2 [Dreissena polymorpha]|uniref:protein N-lysine methyltransferase METTL21D-like isoform X2 n=1 Tax=Dreissena polymorpha TaxID=45954 RepID=UPI002263F29A|nr:protein N-lysine methyltransferase METTL21D-like isoform X2 [Dreissena polymorpha]
MDESKLFVRTIERNDGQEININQCEVGDVGCVVWDAAIVLAKYFETPDFENGHAWRNKCVVELGAGTGVVGLLVASYGAKTIMTDLAEFVPLIEYNIDFNKTLFQMEASAKTLKWGEPTVDTPEYRNIDVVIVADCIYYDESLEPLVNTMYDLCSKDTFVYCCYEERTTGNKPELQRRFIYHLRSLKLRKYL